MVVSSVPNCRGLNDLEPNTIGRRLLPLLLRDTLYKSTGSLLFCNHSARMKESHSSVSLFARSAFRLYRVTNHKVKPNSGLELSRRQQAFLLRGPPVRLPSDVEHFDRIDNRGIRSNRACGNKLKSLSILRSEILG